MSEGPAPPTPSFDDALARGRAAWPEVCVDETAYRTRLEAALGHGGAADAVGVEDLYLVTALEAGDEPAWSCFHRTYRPWVVQALRRVVRDAAEREEIADEVLAGLYLPRDGAPGIPLNTFSGRGALKGWVQVTAVRRVYRRARERARDGTPQPLVDGADVGVASGPEDAAVERELRDVLCATLAEVLESLPASDRTILDLRYVRGFQLKELGKWYGQDKSTVSKRLKALAEKIRGEIRRRLAARGAVRIEDFDGVWEALGRLDAAGLGRSIGGGK